MTALKEAAALIEAFKNPYWKRRVVDLTTLYGRYLAKRRREIEEAKRFAEEVARRPASPMTVVKVVIKHRNGRVYFSAPPRKPPTEPKLIAQISFGELVRWASRQPIEEVAKAVGGEVVDVGEFTGNVELRGRKAILIDGKLLTKTAAVVKLMKDRRWRVPETELEKLARIVRRVL